MIFKSGGRGKRRAPIRRSLRRAPRGRAGRRGLGIDGRGPEVGSASRSPRERNAVTPPAHPFRVLGQDEPALPDAPGTFDLRLERSAFGGGTHPTTVSCLGLMASLAPLTGARVLDLGSGTGILGIAALRLGAQRALCVDVNPDAVASARRNGELNGVADRLDHRLGSADDVAGTDFDLVVANIGGELLLDEAARVARLARPGGRLILSGLLRGWGDQAESAYLQLGCTLLARQHPGEFCTLFLTRAEAQAPP